MSPFESMRWDLDSIFPGGSRSQEFADFLAKIKSLIDSAEKSLDGLKGRHEERYFGEWRKFILELQSIYDHVRHAGAYVGCLTSQDVNDEHAHGLNVAVSEYGAKWQTLMTGFEEFAISLSDEQWRRFTENDELNPIRFYLDDLRDRAKAKMPPQMEKLAISLSVDGYHGWNRLYDKMAGDLRVDFEENGETKRISLGQLANKMESPDRKIREAAFNKLLEAWESRAELAAMALNSQAGFRLALYNNRNWQSHLYEPLKISRLKQETLDAMWSAVAKSVHRLKPYIEAKKRFLNIDKFKWFDQSAPVGKLNKVYSYPEACSFIVKHLSSFSKEMGDFSQRAMEKRWVEAEDRPGKAAGGFCTGFPLIKESRIFMTFSGTFGGVSTLAHELGHAYHSFVLNDKPSFAARYPMTLAETASTFNELRVTDAALELTEDPQEKLMLLDQKIANGFVMLCNIRARFIFDDTFYAERKRGFVPKSRLNQLMVEAQKKAYGDLIEDDGWHPLFWASKLHFFITAMPFYNFPYTFGFLFANGVYDIALKEGRSFAEKYRALLADTGSMTNEDLARKHLGVDLSKEEFWSNSIDRVLSDIEIFVKMAG